MSTQNIFNFDSSKTPLKAPRLDEGVARKTLHLLFVVDNSGSMSGERISAVNNAIRDLNSILPDIQDDTADANIMVSALTFAEDAKWVHSEPKSVYDFSWKDVISDGGTNYSLTFDELNKFLSKRQDGGQMPDFGGIAPIIIFMSDGMPTSEDWKEHLDKLNANKWFKNSLRYALAINIEDQEALNILKEFSGSSDRLLKVYNAEALRKIINVVVVSTTKVQSKSHSVLSGSMVSSNELAAQEINLQLNDVDGIEWGE